MNVRTVACVLSCLTLHATVARSQDCTGDCNDDGSVTINELIVGVNLALGNPTAACAVFDRNGDGMVVISDLVDAVNRAQLGCELPVVANGVCLRPGTTSSLEPCVVGTSVQVIRCDDPSRCLGGDSGFTVIDVGAVGAAGRFEFNLARDAVTDQLLIFEAEVEPTTNTTYRVIDLGPAAAGRHAGGPAGASLGNLVISPSTEAAVRLLAAAGLANFDRDDAVAVIEAVVLANAETDFSGMTAEAAVLLAIQIAEQDPRVQAALARGATPTVGASPSVTPTATHSASPTSTVTPPAMPTPTATPSVTPTSTIPSGRFVDNGDGTISDPAAGLMWEKKVGLGGGFDAQNLHDADNPYTWAGVCSLAPAVLCQPNAAAAAACSQGAGAGQLGCAECQPGEGTCMLEGSLGPELATIWDWVAQLNAAQFAGHSDWRVPTVAELATLGDYGKFQGLQSDGVEDAFFASSCGATCLDLSSSACSCNQPNFYWTASPYAPSPTQNVWTVFLGQLVQIRGKTIPLPVRAVRGSEPPPPMPRFIDNLDGTVTDRRTGLTWEKKVKRDDSIDSANLQDADNPYVSSGRCTGTNKHCQPTEAASAACMAGVEGEAVECGTCTTVEDGVCDTSETIWTWLLSLNAVGYGGYTDWRLPKVLELLSLVDYSDTAQPLIDLTFDGANCGAACADVTSPACSCTYTGAYLSPELEFFVAFSDGSQGTAAFMPRVRAVRDGP